MHFITYEFVYMKSKNYSFKIQHRPVIQILIISHTYTIQKFIFLLL